MPPVSQFPPARVFLKTPVSAPLQTANTTRRASLTSPLSPRFTTMSSITSPSRSVTVTQRSNGTAASLGSRRSGTPTFVPSSQTSLVWEKLGGLRDES
ncbi:hypothetical protein BKA66DRAFT_429603 [Pyrenochaeta sp. MPI-SDFR-AT-0127]|nr:hypothetical protein BKA66DRAFT_429603 [Pyrenochaeta sp. MPI-SDFR-AT-0127]